MAEVLISEKLTIESITNELFVSREEIKELKKQIHYYKSNDYIKDILPNILSYDILIQNPLFKSLSDTNSALVNNIKELQLKMDDLTSRYNEILKWKDNHKCIFNPDDADQILYDKIYNEVKDDIINEINVKDSQDYINLKTINDNNNIRISELENTIKFDKQAIIDEVTLKLETNFSLEKEQIKQEHNNIINSIKKEYQKTIEDLKLEINSNSKNKKTKKDKNLESIDNKFGIFTFDVIDNEWKKYISCFTYKDILRMVKLDKFINDDKKVNKEDYKEVYEWLNIYELDENKIKLNYNIKRKINRCNIIHNKYKDKLKYVKFNINILSYMKNKDFDNFLKFLDEKINQINFDNMNIKEEIKYECKNELCSEYVIIKDTYCDDCIPFVKKCSDCNKEFVEDTILTKCFECRDIDED